MICSDLHCFLIPESIKESEALVMSDAHELASSAGLTFRLTVLERAEALAKRETAIDTRCIVTTEHIKAAIKEVLQSPETLISKLVNKESD